MNKYCPLCNKLLVKLNHDYEVCNQIIDFAFLSCYHYYQGRLYCEAYIEYNNNLYKILKDIEHEIHTIYCYDINYHEFDLILSVKLPKIKFSKTIPKLLKLIPFQ